jgi:hypothetical protein
MFLKSSKVLLEAWMLGQKLHCACGMDLKRHDEILLSGYPVKLAPF